jgi:hypothetical protein
MDPVRYRLWSLNMEIKLNHSEDVVENALENVKTAAEKVRICPSCQSDRIYSALNIAYYFDHLTHHIGVRGIVNLAEHGWHGCYECGHKWVSNGMLQTALPPRTEPAPKNNVIDITRAKTTL